jgi:protein-tyrosine phosphatase
VIDLHNHILPGIDDGASNLQESLEIARQFAAEGVVAIAATPHLDPLHGRGATPAEVRERLVAVQCAVDSADLGLRLHLGQEVFLTPEVPDLLQQGRALTLAGSTYVLVEVSLVALERPLYLDAVLFRLQIIGYRPILAHPERYPFVQRDPAAATDLVGRGTAFQLTAPALLGDYGGRTRRTAERLLESGAYALAGSDRHHPGKSRSLASLAAKLAGDYDAELAALLLRENPRRVLENRALIAPAAVPRRHTFSFTRLLQR